MSIVIEGDIDMLEKIKNRITEISNLKKGWLCGIGNPFDKECLKWAEDFIIGFIYPHFSKPAIIPCEGETLSLEWVSDKNLVSVELILDRHIAIFDSLNRETEQFDYEEVDLKKKDGMECLANLLKKVLY